MRKKSKEDDDDDSEESASSGKEESQYAFAGYNVEFSEKIALTPPAEQRQQKGQDKA